MTTVRVGGETHLLKRPALVHQLKSRNRKVYSTKCGLDTEDINDVTGWHHLVTCNDCSPT